jgi:hypothetical protein
MQNDIDVEWQFCDVNDEEPESRGAGNRSMIERTKVGGFCRFIISNPFELQSE